MKKLNFISIVGALITAFYAPLVAAETVEEFYKGKTVKFIISSGAGGGYDAYARSLVRHISKHIPGNPTIVPQNMPGAGGLRAANFIYNVAPKDGSLLAVVHRGVPMVPLLGIKGAQFEATKFNWIGSLNNEVSVCVSWHTVAQKTVQDAMNKELIIGGSGANDTEGFPAVMNNIIGTKFKIISGYPSGTAINLAMERREVDGRCGWSWSSVKTQHPDWLEDKKVNILMQMSLTKHPELPNVPLVMDMAKSEQDKKVLELVFARQVMGRPVLMPPEVPADRVATIRKAFDATIKDPAFIADMKKQKLELTPISGLEIQALIKKVYATEQSVVALAKDASIYKGKRGKAKIDYVKVKGTLAETEKGGRKLKFKLKDGKTVKTKVSGSRTKVMLAGNPAKRSELKPGMVCEVTYTGSGTEAKQVNCK